MPKHEEDVIVAILKDIPIFCVGRIYERIDNNELMREQFRFRYNNDRWATVIEFNDKFFSFGCKYEMSIPFFKDVYRGSAEDIDRILTEFEDTTLGITIPYL